MAAQVILRATAGSLRGKEYVFTGQARCLVGRALNCSIRLPPDDRTVSRHHCLLEIDAPAATVRDLGSTNGTFVNGQRVGRLDGGAGAGAETREWRTPRHLWCGDELRVGDSVFRVRDRRLPCPSGPSSAPWSSGRPCWWAPSCSTAPLRGPGPRIVTEQPSAALIRASGKCAECHANLQYSVVHEYELTLAPFRCPGT